MDNVKKIQDILNKKNLVELDLDIFDLTEEELETIDHFGDIYSIKIIDDNK